MRIGGIMPTRKRRLSVTLPDECSAELDRLSALSGQSVSSIIGELVEQAMPILARMSQALEDYAAADAEKQRTMVAALERAHSDLLPDAESVIRRSHDAWEQASK